MTRLLDRIAWLIYLTAPISCKGRWFFRIVGDRVADAMQKRNFQPLAPAP